MLAINLSFTQQNFDYESLTIEDGLSQGMIFDIIQTRDGFLWIATKDGLNRYDGYNFKVFTTDPFNGFSLSENTVVALLEDSRGWLWIGTESKGFEIYDRQSGRFYHIPAKIKVGAGAFDTEWVSIQEAPDGAIWALQISGALVRISIPAAWKTKLPDEPDLGSAVTMNIFQVEQVYGKNSKVPEYMHGFNFAGGDSLLLFSNRQQYICHTKAGKIVPCGSPAFPDYIDDVDFVKGSGNGEVWFVNQKGLYHRMGQSLEFTPFTFPKTPERLHLECDAQGRRWLLADKHLWQITGKAIDFSQPDWQMDEMPTRLTSDRNGNIWVGTLGYGLRKFNARKKLFHPGAKGTTVWGLWRDTRDRYYCKVVNRVYPYDPVNKKIGDKLPFPKAPARLIDMVIESSGAVWLFGREDAETGKAELRCYDTSDALIRSFSFDFGMHVYARMLQYSDGTLWFSGTNCEIVRLNPETGQIQRFYYSDLFREQVGAIKPLAMAEDGNGTLWIGTQKGLVKGRLEGASMRFELIHTDPKNRAGLSHDVIDCLLPDPAMPREILWIGTKGGGINRLDIRTGTFEHITTKQGLPNNVVYGILPGREGELWCSTNRGLVKISFSDREKHKFEINTFTAATGLQDNEFNTQAFSKAANGELLFGGVNGLNRFFSEALRLDTTPCPVFVVGLEINYRPAAFEDENSPLEVPLEFLQNLELDHDQNNLSFEFAALDFTDPAKNRYRYRLKGLDDEWVELRSKHFAHFTHLRPGKYTLYVQGSNGEGPWMDAANTIHFVIKPPWWRSQAAYLVYILFVLGAIWQIYQFQIRRVKLREQLAFEHRETERMRAIEQMKTNFFSNITHEFRTPLTLIAEPVRQILQHPNDPQLVEKLKLVDHNSQRLLTLVNHLLDLAKLESGSMPLDLRYANFDQSIQVVFESFQTLARQKNIQLTLSTPAEPLNLLFDAHKVELVLNNLLANALRFTPESGHVHLQYGVELPGSSNKSPGRIWVKVTDDGLGIPTSALQKIFDRFYQVEDTSNQTERAGTGTGIGLALSKDLAELMGGGLFAVSPPPDAVKGSVFVFWLPLTMSGFKAGESQPSLPAQQSMKTGEMPASVDGTRPVVLIIEDNVDLRTFIRMSIADTAQVLEASDGEKGLQEAIEKLPDLIISDIVMPGKNGYEVCDALKNNEITGHIPIILLTARSGQDAKLQGLRAGADDYLTKPFHTEELLVRIENLLEQRRKLRRRYTDQMATPASAAELQAETLPAMSPMDQAFLDRFTETLKGSLSDDSLGVEEFAKKMYVSRVQLHRKLKAITDQSATDFIRDFRLREAMKLLKTRTDAIADISAAVGFKNEKHFSTVFKEKYGVSPKDVRRG